jgi:predicted nuclease with TOPRIM domain
MAELTTLEEKLAEVTGLAAAAQEATKKVESLLNGDSGSLTESLQRMRDEAEQTESRCTELADARDGKKTAILEKAQETKKEATEMMRTYLGEDADELDGFEFLVMAEAGEVGHWAVLGKLNEKAGEDQVQQLVDWALPIQEQHFSIVRAGSLELAAEEDPNG